MSSPSLEPSSSGSSPSVDSYIGSLISLTSKSEIRYEGILANINPQESTIALQNVKSFGTEGRRKEGPQIPANDKVYEYIVFRGSDIKDLQVKSSSSVHTKQQTQSQTHNDPAIIQSHYAYAPTSHTLATSVGDGSRAGPSSRTSHQGLVRQPRPDDSLYQTRSHPSSLRVSPALANEDGSMHSQGYVGSSSSKAQAQQQPVPFPPQAISSQNLYQNPETYAATRLPNFSQTATSLAFPSQFALSNPSNSSLLQSGSASAVQSLSSHLPAMPSLASSNQELNTMKSISEKDSPLQTSFTFSSMPSSSSLILGSTISPITMPSPLLTPDQLTNSLPKSSHDRLYSEPKDMGSLLPSSMNSSSVVPGMPPEPVLPTPSQQGECRAARYTEEFDFNAMNEKFNKDEIWGFLGKEKEKANQGDGTEYNTAGHVNENALGPPRPASKSVYNKDDFFDTLSCNSLNRGRSGRSRLSDRMKHDTEAFGEFQQQRPPMGHGNYQPPHGYHRGSYNRGRGYGNGARSRPQWL